MTEQTTLQITNLPTDFNCRTGLLFPEDKSLNDCTADSLAFVEDITFTRIFRKLGEDFCAGKLKVEDYSRGHRLLASVYHKLQDLERQERERSLPADWKSYLHR